MEAKTCEEYVLQLLEESNKKLEKEKERITNLVNVLQVLINLLSPKKEENQYTFNPLNVEQYESLISNINQILS